MMDNTARAVLCLCVLLLVAQVRSSDIPAKMNRTIQSLLQHYKIPSKERYDGKLVFDKKHLSGKANEVKKVFLGVILETYAELLNKMLEQLPTPDPSVDGPANANGNNGSSDTIRNDLKYILEMVSRLKTNYREEKTFVDDLKALQKIATGNLVVQSKALGELPWLYDEASSLLDNSRRRRRRRRRQTLRAKTQPK